MSTETAQRIAAWATVTPCQCRDCTCNIPTPAEADEHAICAYCQIGDHHTTGETA